jgi:chloride channel protein, CIC family
MVRASGAMGLAAPMFDRFVLPARLRGFVRRSEIALIGLAIMVGAGAAVLVALTSAAVDLLHHLVFGVPWGERLSSAMSLDSPFLAVAPAAGGLILGVTGIFIKRWRPWRPVDAIEANALRGGHMSLIDSILIALQTIVSCGFGASVGLEAGYTQIGAGIASTLGAAFKMRRSDMRTLVGCGAAGAIAAAFGAPLTGAFYAFELIIGTYTPFGLAPVIAAAISAVLVAAWLGVNNSFVTRLAPTAAITSSDLVVFFLLALVCAIVGIGIMRGVTFVEALFKKSHVPSVLQPVFGGLVVGTLALASPHILASGHGALFQIFRDAGTDVTALCLVVVLKSIASAVSIGSGFRGGLFFASLFLGGMVGKIFSGLVPMLVPGLVPDAGVYVTVGMTALGVAIVGGPLTMSFLALETTGDFRLSIVVLTAATIVSVVVRRTFGYSFATWRLHLRGESIRSAQDVGWLRTLTVARMMRTDVAAARFDQSIAAFRDAFPLGSTQWVVGVDAEGRYIGLVSVTDAHLAKSAEGSVATLLRNKDDILLSTMNIKEAADIFERTESEALAALDDRANRKPIGLLSEAHVLRRYTEELEKARRDLSGEKWLGET